MDETDKAKEAKAKLEQARKDAADAEIVTEKAAEAIEDAAESVEDLSQKAAEATEAAPEGAEPGESGGPEAASEDDGSSAQTEPGEERDATVDEPEAAAEPEIEDEHAEEQEARRPLSATILQWLAILVVGAGAALWLGPKIAPNLPGWASPVAAFLTPGADQTLEAVDAAKAEAAAAAAANEAKIAELEAALAELAAARSTDAASADQAIAALAAQVDEIPESDQAAIEEAVGGVAGRLTKAEAALEGLRAEIAAIEGFTGENAAPSAETLERVAAFGAAVEGLRAEIAALSEKAALIDSRAAASDLAAVEARVAALEGGEAATAEAASDAAQIRRRANIDAALTDIARALRSGDGFASALATAENLSGEPAPDALTALKEGAPTVERLAKMFPGAAQNAYAAALNAEAGEGLADRMFAALQGRVGGRPAIETEGDDAGAVLSRVEARLGEGDLDAALAETAALPEAAKAEMTGWIAALGQASAARRALGDWRAALGAN